MKLHTIETGHFKLDGGAMFGVVPKSIWQKTNPSDENNLCDWAMRCLLVEDGNRLVLIDNGIGNKQSGKFFSHYFLHGDDTLLKSLARLGFGPDDITDMFMTHLHFDHCGGGVEWNKDRSACVPVFRNATYWSSERHWEWAIHPNPREKASFLKENIMPFSDSGQLKFLAEDEELFPGFKVFFANGHTDGMMIPLIRYKDKTIVYMADLLPSTGHIPLSYVMGYDTRPLITLEEKSVFMKKAAEENYVLFLEHDPVNECCTVIETERGVSLDQVFRLEEI
jgi:glyoxylase-like metal-dependent hydrolase (beta-lactamase superfamily II)